MSDPHFRFSQFDLDRLAKEAHLADIDFHESLASTSDTALQLSRQRDLSLPSLVLTNEQTAGRGQGANRWLAATGALTFSLIVDANKIGLAADSLSQLSLFTAIAVRDGLASLDASSTFTLKWPNDLYASQPGQAPRKIAGILLERPPTAANRLVIGIGINVNNSHAAAPEEVRLRATSLCELSASRLTLSDVLLTCLKELESTYALITHDAIRLPELWHAHCMLRDREIVARSGSRIVAGRCLGIDHHGALQIQTPSGTESLFSATIEQI